MTQQRRTVRPFTGKKMAAILVAFFAVVISVNVLMARLATSTFGGVVVNDSYLAGQHFNRWLKEAKVEQALGWKGDLARDGQGHAEIALFDSMGKPISAARVTAIAEHPLGRRPLADLVLHETLPGVYAAPLEAGRWRLRVTVEAEGKVWRTVGEVL
ncbi:integral membrane protein linked to a cation pump-like protein [Novosphingobium aromaticivorans DSM 12444]|uniref:Integral membrane protein linked to a cation pump-like protein n=1 Tax=Novosphingobium aromaticivorans (strain ATCC 700278 / DSM 12444 / CCUG 56034 / CIP 105152 / NBRC 16084 / F199) TaxID=279238 RepID=Q2G564_NOVAD|nr:FixH family protein [Novosphingobium aromaticivorans]ABD27009.1 integral membrane protein linked to a cation pump-like protein [Novosphingobium aromaticivorans DSM 12444]SCY47826.1 Nitrogen fixation protein FixH [Novosphingobium aromaticivorans]